MIQLTPGVAQGSFEMLGIASRNPITFPAIRASFSDFSGVSVETVLEFAQGLDWLQADKDGIVLVTTAGQGILSLSTYETRLRRALLDYVESERPAWLQATTYGRTRLLAFAGSQVYQVFVEARLAEGTDDDVVEFWDELAARARGHLNDHLLAIGRKGEKLTLRHERQRTGNEPKWISIENNQDGYDVLSIVNTGDRRQLSIEVKASNLGRVGSIHITRNEWQRALDADAHLFHIWDLSNATSPELAVANREALQDHVPFDRGDGKWESIVVPIATFDSLFGNSGSYFGDPSGVSIRLN